MRTVLFCETGSGFGGSTESLYLLLSGLDRWRIRPVVVASREGEAMRKIRALGIPVYVLPVPEAKPRGYLATGIWLLRVEWARYRRISRLLRREQIELVHTNNDLYSSLAVLAAARRQKLPIVCHLRLTRRPTRLERRIGRWVDRIIVLTEEAKAFYQRVWPAARITCIPNGVPIPEPSQPVSPLRERLRLPSTQRIVGLIARCVPGKGYEEFIQAARLVRAERADVTFVILGNGRGGDAAYEARVHGLAEALGLDGALIWGGWHPAAADVYGALDIVVQASSTFPEGLSRVVLEAMAFSKAVIATDIVGNREAVVPQETGLLVKPGSAEALAEAIVALVRDPERAARYGAQGRARAAARFSVQVCAARMRELYDEVFRQAGT